MGIQGFRCALCCGEGVLPCMLKLRARSQCVAPVHSLALHWCTRVERVAVHAWVHHGDGVIGATTLPTCSRGTPRPPPSTAPALPAAARSEAAVLKVCTAQGSVPHTKSLPVTVSSRPPRGPASLAPCSLAAGPTPTTCKAVCKQAHPTPKAAHIIRLPPAPPGARG